MIDITMTATRRPSIIETTLKSFRKNLLKQKQARLIINIDPIGENCSSEDIIKIVSKYVDNVVLNIPLIPSFPAAFKWCWDQARAPFILNLEDDWELLEDIDIEKIFRILSMHKELALLRIPWFRADEKEMKNWNKFYPWNGEYFECPQDLRKTCGFAGHPSIIKREFVRGCVSRMNNKDNPEKQFHGNWHVVSEVMRWQYGVYGYPNSAPMLRELGNAWKQEYKFKKKGTKAFFTEWEKFDTEE